MTAETDFHQKRRAFVLLEGGILLAREAFPGSHFDLLRQSGFDEETARQMIAGRPRGYALDGNVYFYQGDDFSVLCEQNRREAVSYLDFFRRSGFLSPEGKVFDGMQAGKIGENWTPVKEF